MTKLGLPEGMYSGHSFRATAATKVGIEDSGIDPDTGLVA